MVLEVLVIDDDAQFRDAFSRRVRAHAHHVLECGDLSSGLRQLDQRRFDLVLVTHAPPRVDGFEILRHVRRESMNTDVVLLTEHATLTEAVAAMREQAADYVEKPLDDGALARLTHHAERRRAPSEPGLDAARPLDDQLLWGDSPAMTRLADRVSAIAASDAAVLLTGETGTGKELVARAIHGRSRRAARPFVAINCAAFPETLIEEELFGHERGAFTGALRRREGRFRAAHGGTLFLDEIAELSAPAQAKLLRVLQDLSFEPIGSNTTQKVDVRVISATHRDLRELVNQGRFRDDLYYRIKVCDIHMPALRERPAELPPLIEHFLRRLSPDPAAPVRLTPRARARLLEYSYPGNIRELAHALEHAIVLARGRTIDLEHLPTEVTGAAAAADGGETTRPLAQAVREFERDYLVRVLHMCGGVRVRAAQLLGISRKTLWTKLRELGLGHENGGGGDHGNGNGTDGGANG
jgi:two-component system NtrC family response regulator